MQAFSSFSLKSGRRGGNTCIIAGIYPLRAIRWRNSCVFAGFSQREVRREARFRATYIQKKRTLVYKDRVPRVLRITQPIFHTLLHAAFFLGSRTITAPSLPQLHIAPAPSASRPLSSANTCVLSTEHKRVPHGYTHRQSYRNRWR